jgi:hypothetical protein
MRAPGRLEAIRAEVLGQVAARLPASLQLLNCLSACASRSAPLGVLNSVPHALMSLVSAVAVRQSNGCADHGRLPAGWTLVPWQRALAGAAVSEGWQSAVLAPARLLGFLFF